MAWSTPLTSGTVPEPRSRHTCTALAQRLVFIGGGDQSRLFNDVHVYDSETREWTVVRTKGKAPSGRWGHSTTLVDANKLFVFGGHDGKVRLNDVFILHLGVYLALNIAARANVTRDRHHDVESARQEEEAAQQFRCEQRPSELGG